MYECCSVKRFFKLLVLDALIFSLCSAFFLIGRGLLFSSAGNAPEEPVFLPAIMYHSVFDGSPSDYVVTPGQLEDDLRWLSSNGYTSVTAEQLCSYVRGGASLPEKPVLITFDDGFYNNLSLVLPLLEKYDMHAVVSVVGSYTDERASADPHDSRFSYLTWEDISSLSNSERVEIGSHTYDMHSLSGGRKGCSRSEGESAEEYTKALRTDLGLLSSELLENCGISPIVFAYPFGAVSREAGPVLRELGFMMTLTCREAPNYITRDPDCLFGIGRYNRSGLYSTAQFMEMIKEDENG